MAGLRVVHVVDLRNEWPRSAAGEVDHATERDVRFGYGVHVATAAQGRQGLIEEVWPALPWRAQNKRDDCNGRENGRYSKWSRSVQEARLGSAPMDVPARGYPFKYLLPFWLPSGCGVKPLQFSRDEILDARHWGTSSSVRLRVEWAACSIAHTVPTFTPRAVAL